MERDLKKDEVYINGKKTKWTDVREYPGYFHMKYKLENNNQTFESFYATMHVVEQTKTKQVLEFEDELPTNEKLWAEWKRRGVLI